MAVCEFDKELTRCPECGGTLTLTEPITSNGGGIAAGVVECGQCDWKAEEQWVIDFTREIRS